MSRMIVNTRRRFQLWAAMIITCCFGMMVTEASAQGLVWNLPESGTWVRYVGEYRQITLRPGNSDGDLTMTWQRVLEIRCLEREEAEWQSKSVPCVWLEFDITTGQQVDGQLEAGPGATRIYKLLVPESQIIGKKFLELEIAQAYLPIVKGFRKIGDGEAEPLKEQVFQIFPVLSQVFINEKATIGNAEAVNVSLGNFQAERVECTTSIEDTTSRSINTTELWIAEEAPFGPVKWNVRIDREVKTLVETRDKFRKHSEISVQMEAAQTGNDAQSKI